MSDCVRPHRRQPTRLPCSWDSPDKNTGVGCHCLLHVSLLLNVLSGLVITFLPRSKHLQLCPTLCDPPDYNPPGSSVHRILQARILEWVAISSSRRSSKPKDSTCLLHPLHFHHCATKQLRPGLSLDHDPSPVLFPSLPRPHPTLPHISLLFLSCNSLVTVEVRRLWVAA